MNKSITLLLAAGSAGLFSACLFQNGDSPSTATAKFEFQASAASSALAKSAATGGLSLVDAAGTSFNITEAKVYVKRIQLESETESDVPIAGCDTSGNKIMHKDGDSSATEVESEECESDQDLSIKGPFIVDLINGTSTPELPSLSVPAGTYNRIKLRLDHGAKGDTAMLDGNSLVAKGTLTRADGSTEPFTLNLGFHEDLKIKSKTGIVLDGSSIHTILVALSAGDWLKNLNVAGCLAQDTASGTAGVTVSENSPVGKCLDAEHALKDNFRKSCEADEQEGPETKDDKGGVDNSGKGK